MHIELTELLRCPEPHQPDPLVLSTGEMAGRMVRTGLVGCPVCRKEYPIVRGPVYFTRGRAKAELARAPWIAEAQRVLLRGRRLVIEDERAPLPDGVTQLAAGHGLLVGEKG